MKKLELSSAVLLAALLFAGPASAQGPITYGTLDNFDVVNDTGGECHGFEIELEGVSPADVVYTFGAPYQRYGDPTVVSTATGVIIRYAAAWSGSAWSAATPIADPATVLPVLGHSCWTGGVTDPAQYYASGCDHFGASLNAVPAKTTYRWLVDVGSGTLKPFGTPPALPAPVWNVTPPAVPGGQPIAAAAIKPPPPAAGFEFGDAIWAKVFVTELPEHVHAEDLRHMIVDDPDVDIVPNEDSEVEMEWVLMQASTENEGEESFGDAAEVGAGSEAVSRRFEFYKYAGAYDENHEALCDNPVDCPGAVGDLIGTSNAAVNLAGDFAVNNAPVANGDSVSTNEDTALTLAAIDLVGNDTDVDLDPLTIVSAQDAVGGSAAMLGGGVIFTPDANFNGPASFTYTISDGRLGTSTATVSVTVNAVNDAPVADAGPDQTARLHDTVTLDGTGSSDVEGSSLTYSWALAMSPVKSHVALTGADTAHPTFYADKKGPYTFMLTVSDGALTSTVDYVSVVVKTGK